MCAVESFKKRAPRPASADRESALFFYHDLEMSCQGEKKMQAILAALIVIAALLFWIALRLGDIRSNLREIDNRLGEHFPTEEERDPFAGVKIDGRGN